MIDATADEVVAGTVEEILRRGDLVHSRLGPSREVLGMTLSFTGDHVRQALEAESTDTSEFRAMSKRLPEAVRILKKFPETRRCSFYVGQFMGFYGETWCCTTFTAFSREHGVEVFVGVRSLDVFTKLRQDLAAMGALGRRIADELGAELHRVTFHVASAHVYIRVNPGGAGPAESAISPPKDA